MMVQWTGPTTPWTVRAISVTVREWIDQPYELTVELELVGDAPLNRRVIEPLFLGQTASVAIGERVWAGFIQQVAVNAVTRLVSVVLRPPFAKTELATDCRLFREVTVPEVIAILAKSVGAEVTEQLRDPTYRYPVCVQYREDGLRFAHRLAEGDGLTMLYANGRVILTDDPATVFPNAVTVGFREEHRQGTVPSISAWLDVGELVSGTMELGSWNWATPQTNLAVTDEVPGRLDPETGSVFDMGRYPDPEWGGRQLVARLEREAVCREQSEGKSNVPEFAPGVQFQFDPAVSEPAPPADPGDVFLLVSVVHHATNEPKAVAYWNQFVAIPATTRYRPERKTPKPTIAGLVPATIVTADGSDEATGQEVALDEFGRVSLRFPWQRGQNRTQVTPARVSQYWAGKGWGAWYAPRIGQEVLVGYDEGDPNSPVVVGCVYHAAADIPFDIQQFPTRSGVKGRSSPDGTGPTGNEQSFEDKAGGEELTHFAERDHRVTVQGGLHSTSKTVQFAATEDMVISAKRLTLRGTTEIVLQVEGSVVTITAAELAAKASMIHLNGPSAPAARVGDACLETVPAAPKVVLPPGNPTVTIGGKPAAVMAGQVAKGSSTVTVGGLPLARTGDPTVTGGQVTVGEPTVTAG